MNVVGDINARRGEVRGDYAVADFSTHHRLCAEQAHQRVFRIGNLTDEIYPSRADRGTLDITGVACLYDNLGTNRAVHASYTRRF